MRQNRRAAGARTRPPGEGRYRIGVLLVALALLPLTGVAWFGVAEVRGAQAALVQAESVDASVTRLVYLTELRIRLLDERNWTKGSVGVSQIGLSRELVADLTGFDLEIEQSEAQDRVDELVEQLGLDEVRPLLAEARVREAEAQNDLLTTGTLFDEIANDIAEEAEQTLDELLATAGWEGGSEDLVTRLRVLESATIAQQAVSAEFNYYFRAQVSGLDIATEVVPLVGQRAIRTEAEAELRRKAEPDARSRRAMEAIDESAEVRAAEREIAALVDTMLVAGQTAPGASGDSLLAGDLDGLVTKFRDNSQRTELYFELVDAAGTDALGASAALGVTARNEVTDALVSVVGLVALSLLSAGAATQAIDRPIRRLAEVARRISDGDSGVRFGDAGGSIEIREAGRAIDAAAAHLALAEQQAKALAEGDLDHPILSSAPTGQLGASLQVAVEALASSMQEREEFRRRMTHEATHDGLTQIANRNASLAQLRRGLARVRRSDSMLAVLFLDLDGFKEVNDNEGHHVGDAVLRATAQRLVNAVRDGDHVGRLGGDEFLVIAEPVGGIDETLALADRLLQALSEPLSVDDTQVSIGASVGIALSDGSADTDSADLLRDADLAVYKAKAEGRGRVEICDDELRTAMFERADLERALRRAIDELEFVLHYQPIIEPERGHLHGFEALIRWNRTGHGMVSPDSFIPVAERSDLILAIDRWVLGAAIRQIRDWDAEGLFPGVPVSVNLSGRHLGSPSLIDDVLSPLRDHDVDPSRLVVEITESALLEDLEGAAAKLHVLRSHGIRIAIDDFGTGYTSLAHLKSLPIDILKIDRSYTNDTSASSLVKLIIDTGHLLGATITAEGIETLDQASHLAGMGSDELQGYLYGRPLAPADLDRSLAAGPVPPTPPGANETRVPTGPQPPAVA